jgi:hypothetical protein
MPPTIVTGSHAGERLVGSAGLVVRDATLADCDLSDRRLPTFQAAGSSFERCDFSRVTIGSGNMGSLPWVTYRDCRFVRANLSRALPAIARFEGCLFDHATLDRWFCPQAEFVDCVFAGPLRSVRFHGTVDRPDIAARLGRTRNEFVGNDFRAADLVDVELVGGIDLSRQHWPDSPEYVVVTELPQRLERARGLVELWPDPAARAVALRELTTLTSVYRGQSAMIRRRGQRSAAFERLWLEIEGVDLGDIG